MEGIIVSKSGHATAYAERFVNVILRKLGPFALRIGKKHSVWCISLSVYVHCIHYVYGHSDFNSKGKLYTFSTLCCY